MLETIEQILLAAVPMLMAITVHEVAHGWAAYLLGDDTAYRQGRLSLNPLKHLDPMGTLVFAVTRMIGWAKPVPVNFYRLRNPKRDMIWVALAGPASNLILAAASGQILRFLVFNQALFPLSFLEIAIVVCKISLQMNIALAVFNLVPILPLDGGRVLTGLLADKQAKQYASMEKYGMVLIMLFVMTGSFNQFFLPVVRHLYALFLGI